jgi:hypothetical protein
VVKYLRYLKSEHIQNAIAKSNDYDDALKLWLGGWNNEEIFWELAIEDIRATADLFHSLYCETTARWLCHLK